MSSGTLTERLQETLAVFDAPGRPRTTTEVADDLDLGRRSTYDRLDRLVDHGRLESKKVGSSGRVWWRPVSHSGDGADPTPAGGARGPPDQQLDSLVAAVEEYAIFRLDAEGYIETWNAGAHRIKGYSAAEALGKHVSMLYTEDDRAAGVPEENLAVASTEGTLTDEGWRVRADGSVFWASVTITAIRDDAGDLDGYTKVTRDMTERHESEQRLREEKAFVESLLDAQHDIVYALDERGEFIRWNPRFREVTGYTDEEIDVLSPADIIADESVDDSLDAIETVIEGGEQLTTELRIETADGTELPYELTASPIMDDGRVVGMTGVGRDISERKARERRLERQRDELAEELDDVFLRIDDAFYAVDEEFRFTYVNARAEELLGYAEAELLGKSVWEAFPRAMGTDIWDALHTALATQDPTSYDVYREALGVWVEANVYPSEDGLSVYFRDITDRKERARRLEEYRHIVENVNDGIYVVDDDLSFHLVNEAYTELTGYSREELLGEHISTVVEADVVEFSRERRERMRTGGTGGTAEVELETASGELLTAQARYTPLFDENGDFRGTVGIIRDITDRKQFEETLEALYDSAHDLLGAETNAAIGDVVVETATEVLDLSGVVTYLVEEESDQLYPAAQSAESGFMRGEFPTIPPDDSSITGHVYATGEPRRFDDITDSPYLQTDATEMRAGVFAPIGEYGVLVIGSQTVGAFDDRTQRLVELLATNAEAAFDRLDREGRLARFERMVEAVTDGVYATDSEGRFVYVNDAYVSMSEHTRAELLDAPESVFFGENVIEPDEGQWRDLVDGERRSADLETDITGPDGDTRTIRNRSVPFEIDDEVGRVGVTRDITAQVERERELERQRERLAALDDLNRIVRDITDAVIAQSTRTEIEEIVCERLAETDSYAFAWIGEVDARTQSVTLRTEAGVQGYLEDVSISIDPADEHSRGPTGRAFREQAIQTVQNVLEDPQYAPWLDTAREYGFRSSAAIPITYEGTLYGVLNVYTERPNAFMGEERSVIEQLGEIVGHAISAVERKQALLSDEVVELRFRLGNVFDAIDLGVSIDGDISLDQTVPAGDDVYLEYGTATGDGIEALEALVDVDEIPHWESVSVLGTDGDVTRFEARLSEPPVITAVAAHNGYVEDAGIEDGDFNMEVHLPTTVDVSSVVETIGDIYPAVELVTRRQLTRDDWSANEVNRILGGELTDRQRSALEASYYAGYFEWPRETDGEEMAESLGVSSPTFHQHLRHAQRKLLGAVLEDGENAS